jgi:hypothetical protein
MCVNLMCVWPCIVDDIFLIFTLFYLMGLYSTVIQYIVSTFLKFKREQLELLQMLGIRDSCRDLFKKLHILPFYSQHIYSLLKFVVKNRSLLKLNSDIHWFSTRYDNDFHLPSANLKLLQKGVLYSGIKTYNHLPKTIKELSHDVKQFRLALKRFILSNSFHSLEEYFDINL